MWLGYDISLCSKQKLIFEGGWKRGNKPLPTGIGERYCQTISVIDMQRSCADVNFPYKRKCWSNSGAPKLIHYSEVWTHTRLACNLRSSKDIGLEHVFYYSCDLAQIADPVRFVVETKARIFPSSERFWYYSRRSFIRRLDYLLLFFCYGLFINGLLYC